MPSFRMFQNLSRFTAADVKAKCNTGEAPTPTTERGRGVKRGAPWSRTRTRATGPDVCENNEICFIWRRRSGVEEEPDEGWSQATGSERRWERRARVLS